LPTTPWLEAPALRSSSSSSSSTISRKYTFFQLQIDILNYLKSRFATTYTQTSNQCGAIYMNIYRYIYICIYMYSCIYIYIYMENTNIDRDTWLLLKTMLCHLYTYMYICAAQHTHNTQIHIFPIKNRYFNLLKSAFF
jgi:hypothetical protein